MKSVRRKIFWSFGIIALISSLIAMGLSTFLLLRQEEREAKARIRAEEKNLITLGVIDFISLAEYRQFIDQISASIPRDELNEVIHIYEPPGKLIYSNQSQHRWKIAQEVIAKYVNSDYFEIHQEDREYLAKIHSYETLDGKVFWFEIATLRKSDWSSIKSVASLFGISLLGMIAISLIVAYWLGKKITYPIEAFAQEISRLDPKAVKAWQALSADHDETVEMKPIVRSFKMLMDRLQQTFVRNEYVGRFIAHEIQTPLTVIQGEVEMSLSDPKRSSSEKQLKESVLEEVAKISDVMDTVLKVPYGDRNSSPIQIEIHDLKTLILDVISKTSKTIHREIDVQFSGVSSVKIHTDQHLFSLLLSNLIRNADRHTPSDQSITIHSSVEGNRALIEVIDGGGGLPSALLEAANAENAFSSELGIGLILIKQIADLVQHKVVFENNPSGKGLLVKILTSLAD